MPEPSAADVAAALAEDPRLRVYLRNGRIQTMPAKRSRRLLLLDAVAQLFEPGVRYPEPEVNQRLGALYADYAALRRYLIDEEFLERDGGQYWRVGGQVAL